MGARVNEPRAKMLELIHHLGASGFERITQCLVSALERAAKLVEMFVEHSLSFRERIRRVAIQTLLDDFSNRGMQPVEEIAKLQPVLLHCFLVTPFYDCKTRARQ